MTSLSSQIQDGFCSVWKVFILGCNKLLLGWGLFPRRAYKNNKVYIIPVSLHKPMVCFWLAATGQTAKIYLLHVFPYQIVLLEPIGICPMLRIGTKPIGPNWNSTGFSLISSQLDPTGILSTTTKNKLLGRLCVQYSNMTFHEAGIVTSSCVLFFNFKLLHMLRFVRKRLSSTFWNEHFTG